MEKSNRIVGICLVRNEERFLNQVIANIRAFCDFILIADHRSTDRTPQIALEWEKRYGSISYRRIKNPVESHDMLTPYVNTPSWIFAVDGDEVYDPKRLMQLRRQLLAGEHDGYWRILGNVLNCIELDTAQPTVTGYLSPPSRSITKLYNFNAITSWEGVTGERLHGGQINFKNDFVHTPMLRLHELFSWEETVFRCLHLCFLPRSRREGKKRNGLVARWNLAEQQGHGILTYFIANIFRMFDVSKQSDWKRQKYCRGALVTKDVNEFFNNRQAMGDADAARQA